MTASKGSVNALAPLSLPSVLQLVYEEDSSQKRTEWKALFMGLNIFWWGHELHLGIQSLKVTILGVRA